MVDINVKCRSCGQKSHIGNMKYHPETGKDLVCTDCYNSKLAELNGGRIEVQSESGKGSTFSVYLPVYGS